VASHNFIVLELTLSCFLAQSIKAVRSSVVGCSALASGFMLGSFKAVEAWKNADASSGVVAFIMPVEESVLIIRSAASNLALFDFSVCWALVFGLRLFPGRARREVVDAEGWSLFSTLVCPVGSI